MGEHIDTIILKAPLREVWDFYTNLDNVVAMTLPELRLRVIRAETPLRKGSRVRFAMKPHFMPFEVTWTSRIHLFEEEKVFADKQIKGPFDYWSHRHEFEAIDEETTKVIDRLSFGPPLGIFGRFAEGVLEPKIKEQFRHREEVLRQALEKAHHP